MAKGKQMKILQTMISEKEEQIRQLEIELATLRAALSRATGEPIVDKTKVRRSNVKALVLDLLKEARHVGLNANTAVQMAQERNVRLERGSVSSLLSRLKTDGALVYDSKFYRLKEFVKEEESEGDKPSASIHPLRSSGDAS